MRSWTALAVAAVAVIALTLSLGALAVTNPDGTPVDTSDRSGSDPRTVANGTTGRFARLHAAGVTGATVSVGVVDPMGFDTARPELASHVVAARAFGHGSLNDGSDDHGTAAATVVARTAPEAELYLARIAGVDSYRRAVEWLLDEGVDVIVAPVAFYGQPGDGTGPVARTAARATDAGTVFVAPAGNRARSHWAGHYDANSTGEGTVEFANGSRRNYIRGNTEVTIWLSWDRAHAEEDYTAALYRTNGTATQLVARSQPYRADDVPNERIVASVRPGTYYVTVRGPTEPTGTRLRLVSPTHEFQHADARGSIVAPATARNVVAVGAYNSRVDRLEPFSSRGPTADGRTGVDVVAPDRRFADASSEGFVGSSAAVPYVGGTAALLLDADGTLSPRHVAFLLERTAEDVRRPGVDYATGHGVVDPVGAVDAARNGTDG